MSQSLVIANFATGFETDREPFLINNDAFPTINNGYVWRGRVKKKRGTSFLGRLERTLTSQALGNTNGLGIFSGNIFTILGIDTLSPNAAIAPGSITVTVGAQVFTEPATPDGTLSNGGAGTGAINYATGDLQINTNPVLAATAVTITFGYFPVLPVMGLASFDIGFVNFPKLVAFDTKYAYQLQEPTDIFYDVTFYKTTKTPFTWTGQDYQQFWWTNFQDALWVTNGKAGFHFLEGAYVSGTGTAAITFTFTSGGLPFQTLVVNDQLWFNEWTGGSTINGLTGTVTTVVNAATGTYEITFDAAQTVAGTGIAQMLTNFLPNQDGIRWYDGDPNSVAPPNNPGWVNFAPPLSSAANPDYLVGARMILPFKNRLLFLGVTIARFISAGNYNFISLPNRVVYSQDGTAFYASPVPLNQTFEMEAYFADVAGRGGFITAPITQNLVTVAENEDVLLTGFENRQLKLVFTGDDSFPFFFQTINSELGSQSTFSGITLDTGALTIGEYGIAMTTQVSAQRIDLQIPDSVFGIRKVNNDDMRVTSIRDFRNEFVYFTYCPNTNTTTFPSQTLLYNYRDNTWGIWIENYTAYGTFRRASNITWAQLGAKYGTWAGWNDPWNFGSTEERYPNIIAGNQHGYVMIKDSGTFEAKSEYIQDVDLTTPTVPVILSPDHGLADNDFIEIVEVIGMNNINNLVFKIEVVDGDHFSLLLDDQQLDNPPTGTYLGGGSFRRISNLDIQTKQFPIFWDANRQTRVGTQRFMFTTTDEGEVTVNLFLSQADNYPSNDPTNSAYLIFSNVVLTHPEPENGYPPNPNQMWHRLSNSFIGDTVQMGFSLSDAQMRNNGINSAEIELHGITMELYPGPVLR